MSEKQKMIVGISGATGIIYAIQLLHTLRRLEIESHLVITKTADLTRSYETDYSAKQLRALADVTYNINDLAAPIASGSFKVKGMIVVPCSVRTLGEIATGVTSNLLTRAADVMLKERRRLVLLVRESPLHAVHIKNMLSVTEMGGIIAPPVPAFYTNPKSLEEMVQHTLGRTLDLFDLDSGDCPRWGQDKPS